MYDKKDNHESGEGEEKKMALSKKPVTGMRDILPAEMQLRDYVLNLITETYTSFGFSHIETPCMENIANLTSKQGGENEKLIFKVLKRGEKLKIAEAATEEEVVDFGMRYDLTVPLSRYYSNHSAELPTPFKALQMGPVWRADRPQKGRFRQFVQCDIDILGDPTNLAEIELMQATTTLLGRLGFRGFRVCFNDRRMLKAMAAFCGFPEADYDQVFIILDKMDKIGMDGVAEELKAAGYDDGKVEKYLSLFTGVAEADSAASSGAAACGVAPDGTADSAASSGAAACGAALDGTADRVTSSGAASDGTTDSVSSSAGTEGLKYLRERLGNALPEGVAEDMTAIMEGVKAAASVDFELVFDPTLVRGMSYYTGPIFEIKMPELSGSVAGGGRYDEMIGRFTGQNTPACGFSIGFERIITILMEQGFRIPGTAAKKAFLIEKGTDGAALARVLAEAKTQRESGAHVLVAWMNKNKKFQKEQLAKDGYEEFREFFRER